MPGQVRIGISGWTYKPWRGVFYPVGLAHKKELCLTPPPCFPPSRSMEHFILSSDPSSFAAWAAADSSELRLRHQRQPLHHSYAPSPRRRAARLANFFASGLLALGPKLGPILWQFPPNFQFKPDLLEEFFALLPRDTHTAATLAEKHDERLKGRAYTEPGKRRRIPPRHGDSASQPSLCPNSSASCADTTSLSSVPIRSRGRV